MYEEDSRMSAEAVANAIKKISELKEALDESKAEVKEMRNVIIDMTDNMDEVEEMRSDDKERYRRRRRRRSRSVQRRQRQSRGRWLRSRSRSRNRSRSRRRYKRAQRTAK